jgi:polyphosphate kinase
MNKAKHFINRDISWLSFNERVLQEATDKDVPLVERFRFLGIFSNNRDEFFRVRVATLLRILKMGWKSRELIGENPKDIVAKIQNIVIEQQGMLEDIYQEKVTELAAKSTFIIDEKEVTKAQETFVNNYFQNSVLPLLIPIMLKSTGPFPFLRDKSSYLFIRLKNKASKKIHYALIELPTHALSRFVVLPKVGIKNYIMLLDDVIRFGLKDIFYIFDYDEIESYMIKITRDAELEIEYDLSKSIIEKITKSVKGRKVSRIVRFTYDKNMPPEMFAFLKTKLKLGDDKVMAAGGKYHNFKDFSKFPDVGKPNLLFKSQPPIVHPAFNHKVSIFKVLKKNDILLHFPYHTYNHIIDMLREASIDPLVESIKITLYRVAKNSNVLNALLNAIKNGKQVTVVVELQARFDEENNMYWASKLREEGALIIYGVPNLKVHSKLFLITRKESNKVAHYAHVGTGNFNEQTAKVYSDFSLLTADNKITEEVNTLFDFYSDNLKIGKYKHLLVAPFFMRKRFEHLIDREIKHAKDGKRAFIHCKMNSLVDEAIIDRLYEAAQAGVKIKLIIRGICSMIPNHKKANGNVEIISIVDRYLEHSRIFIFGDNADTKYFISSADWMIRNLDHRSEVAVPIFDKKLQKQLRSIFDIQFADNTKARIIEGNQENNYKTTNGKPVRAQEDIYNYLKQGIDASI